MKWSEVDLDACFEHLSRDDIEIDYLDMKKDIMSRYAKGDELSVKQKNVIKRMYIIEVLKVDIFEDEYLSKLTFSEIQKRIKVNRY